ncbi:Embryonic stem cell-specific 5-hydroxymethylcytosine-binding protein [Triplophysa tibetana]|uniref:Abasic site processing protein HMCES n=1 Tax=Triplophysa tibetana TaxID=1572043 RepID=A0A5A9NFD9_9TELE|nr:Embryonic stem cell-specific 5-hydroxymethylcytosine-binding protein [Triplophysa tibetana]
MCGRTACTLEPEELSRASRYRDRRGGQRRPRWKDGDSDKYTPSYNKSPQSFSPVLLSNRHFNKARTCACWAFVSHLKEQCIRYKNSLAIYMARWSKIFIIVLGGTFPFHDLKEVLQGQRCVILADGFYEWRRQEKEKHPFFIYFPQSQEEKVPGQHSTKEENSQSLDSDQDSEWTGWRLLTIAGLFDSWTPPGGGEALYTYTVITVDASPNIQSIHDRMPAVLDGEEEVRRWLDFGEVKSLEAMKLLQSKSCLTFHPVSSLVNNSRNNSLECVQPVNPTIKKTPQPSASSKMMMSWLKTASPTKRKEPDEDTNAKGPDGKLESEKQNKPSGALQQWLLGTGSSKKPRTL